MSDEQKRDLEADRAHLTQLLRTWDDGSIEAYNRLTACTAIITLSREALPHAIRRALAAEAENEKLRAELKRVLIHVCHES